MCVGQPYGICDSYAKANFRNQENWQRKIAEADGVLNNQVLEAALGKRRPKQRMWGLSGPITIGLSLDLGSEQLLSVNSHLRRMSTTQNIVRALKYTHSLQLWFSGPGAFSDFLVEWC